MSRSISLIVVSMLLVVACGAPGSLPSPVATSSVGASAPTSSTVPAPSAGPTASAGFSPSIERPPDRAKDGMYVVADDGRQVALICRGEGSPTAILESGGPNIEEWLGSGVLRALAEETRVCTYDRSGTGSSDPPPYERRDADDVVSELKALLVAADIDGPYVLVGRSFGGMIVTYYAETEPDHVIGVVVLDTPAPSATFTPESEPGLVWDFPDNTERLDVVGGFENRFAKDPPKLHVPVLVITPVPGEGTAKDESFWLQTSPRARQVEVPCGRGATEGACADEVAKFVASLH